MSTQPVTPTARPVPPGIGRVVSGVRMADAVWPLLSILALLAMLVLVGSDTPAQHLRAHDVAHDLSQLLRL